MKLLLSNKIKISEFCNLNASSKEENTNDITLSSDIDISKIESRIFNLRESQVMLDADLARLYQVETKYLNRQVKRNIERFPSDFMFQLTQEEVDNLRCQNVTSRWGVLRYLPYAFKISRQLQLDINRHNSQFPPITVNTYRQSHDRFLCIDDEAYNIGTSIKDWGKKWFAFSKMYDLKPSDLINRINGIV